MIAAPILTHSRDAVARLLEQYKGKPNITGLVSALVIEIQLLENALVAVDSGRRLANAVGAQLDGIGAIVGVARGGADDPTYRSIIAGQIAENNSDGTSSALINTVAALYQTNAVFRKDPNSPGASGGPGRAVVAFGVGSPAANPANYALINQVLAGAIAAGVGLVYLSSFNASAAFAMAGPQSWVAGFSDVNAPTTGGQFATLIYQNPTL